MSEEFPNRIRELREAKGWSLRQLAAQCGIHFNTLAKLENGITPLDVPRMRMIAQSFGLPAGALLNAGDAECRVDETAQEILKIISDMPEAQRTAVIIAAREVVQIARALGTRGSAESLGGSYQQLSELTRLWNQLNTTSRDRALNMLSLMQGGPIHSPATQED